MYFCLSRVYLFFCMLLSFPIFLRMVNHLLLANFDRKILSFSDDHHGKIKTTNHEIRTNSSSWNLLEEFLKNCIYILVYYVRMRYFVCNSLDKFVVQKNPLRFTPFQKGFSSKILVWGTTKSNFGTNYVSALYMVEQNF